MFKRIKNLLLSKILIDAEVTNIVAPVNMVQEDTNSVKSRVRNMFESQREQMNMRVKVAHGADCKNPDICTDNFCWVFIPDRIKGSKVFKIPKKRRVNMAMGIFKDKDA